MIAPTPCEHTNQKKHGKDRKGNQRFRCRDCGSTFTEERVKPLGNMQITMEVAVLALKMLLEGMSIRATARIKDVPVDDVQIDEIWTFIGMKQKHANLRNLSGPGVGDCWTYTAVERNTKLILAVHVGERNQRHTDRFLDKLNRAVDTSRHPQVSSDGWGGYQYGAPFALGSKISFGQLIKKYAAQQTETRYSPATKVSAEKVPRFGNPDPERICTSHVESLNQKIRMHMRRFTRLTAGHSKSLEHHVAMQNIFFAWYNFCRKHETLEKTSAMASGLTESEWSVSKLLEESVRCANKPDSVSHRNHPIRWTKTRFRPNGNH